MMYLGNVKEIKAIKALQSYLAYYPRWAIPVLLSLGMLTSFSEGIGISLFIPFLKNIGQEYALQQNGNWIVQFLGNLFFGIEPERRLIIISFCIFIAVLMRSALYYANTVIFTWLSMNVGHKIRTRLYEQLMTVNFRYFEKCSSGRLVNALSNETWRATDALSGFWRILITGCSIVVYFTLLLLLSWELTLLVTAVMVAISMIVRLLTRKTHMFGERVTRNNTELTNRMVEGIDGMKVIRAFVRESYEHKRFLRASSTLSNLIVRLTMLNGIISPVYQVLTAVLLLVVLLNNIHNPGNIPAILVFIFILYRFQPMIIAFDGARNRIVSLTPALEEMNLLLAETGESLPDGDLPFKEMNKGIHFQKLTFAYNDEERPALKDLSISIPAGKTTALVGHSGAGKSTLIKLILRFYDASDGDILIDETPLRSLVLESWRQNIALVNQEVYVFNASVRDNIAYGKLDAGDDEIIEAARSADAHEFIMDLPDGYDTNIGDQGVRLSGGQRQRITLARALIKKPAIIILDEATNSLDSISEQSVKEAVEKLSLNCTVIVIAHRLSSIEHADNILVLNEGMVTEQGTFAELIKLNGYFARMYHAQYAKNSIFIM